MIGNVPMGTLGGEVDPRVVEAVDLGTATLHEAAGQVGDLPPQLFSMTPGLTLGGWAFPVRCPPGDNLWVHRALYVAQPGDVLVVDTGGGWHFGYWGEILSSAARTRGLAGVVIDGGIRDTALLEEIGLAVFGRCRCIRGTTKNPVGDGTINEPIRIGDVSIDPGDLVVGDGDGVVVLPKTTVPDVLAKSRERRDKEKVMIDRIREGTSTLELLGLVASDGTRSSKVSDLGGSNEG